MGLPLGVLLRDHDDLALVVHQAPGCHGQQDGYERDVEDEVAQLAGIAALRGEGLRTRAVLLGRDLIDAPLLQHGLGGRGDLLRGLL